MVRKCVAGIDPHKRKIVGGLFDLENRLAPIKYFNFNQDIREYENFYNEVISYSGTINTPFCMEDIDGVGKSLRLYLQSKNAVIYHVPSNYTHLYKKMNPNPEKSDFLDCQYIVQAWQIQPGIKQLRLNLQEDKYTMLKDTAYARWKAGQDLGSIKKKINSMLYKKLGVNYKQQFRAKMYTNSMIEEAFDMFNDKKDPNAIIITSLLMDLKRAKEKCKELDPALKLLATEEVKRLMEIKGCGLLLACHLVGIIKSGQEPKNGKSIKKWFGIAPVEKSTGGEIITHKANKRGYRHGNHLITMIVNTQLNNPNIPEDHPSKILFQKRRTAGDNPERAKQKIKSAICNEVFRKIYRPK